MKKGFEENGCIVDGGCKHLDSAELIQKIDAFKPDFVFEMNRVKSKIDNFPKDVIHICWLVDMWENLPHELVGSDILYLFSASWLKDYPNYKGKIIDVLYPGTDTEIYYPKSSKDANDSLIFLGHMPKPWLDSELKRKVETSCKEDIKFKDLLEVVHEFTIKPMDFNDSVINTKKFILNKLNIKDINNDDRVLHYDIYTRLFREGRRLGVVNQAIKSNYNVNIYGNDNWKLRSQFAGKYKGYLSSSDAMNEAYNQNSFLLHDGSMPHFRIFDAMAAGLFVLRPDVRGYGVEDEWANLNLQEYILDFNLGDENIPFVDLTKKSSLINDIKVDIREKISLAHTWTHRAAKILKDVERV